MTKSHGYCRPMQRSASPDFLPAGVRIWTSWMGRLLAESIDITER